MRTKPVYVAVTAGGEKALKAVLGEAGYSLVEDAGTEETFEAMDTFDWRFFNKGLLVLEVGERFIIFSFEEEETLGTAPSDEGRGGHLPGQVAAVAGIRRLLDVSTWFRHRGCCRILDDQGKLIGRGDLYRSRQTRSFFGLKIVPLRGYQGECEGLARRLAASGGIRGARRFYGALLSRGGRRAGAYSPAVTLSLAPELMLPEAYGKLFSYFLSILEENRPGILGDLDTEFLHDYRVALRRLRSVTSQMKKEMPAALNSFLSGELKSLFSATSRGRDLDVLALRREAYAGLLPEKLRPGLYTFFDRVEEERVAAYDEIRHLLSSPSYPERMQRLRAAFDASNPQEWLGSLHLRDAVAQWVRKRSGRVLEIMGEGGFEKVPGELHALRIECKKLRYLLETFNSLYSEKELGPILKNLKRFQDALGASQDLAVQTEFLSDMLREWGTGNHAVAGAIGGLLTELNRRGVGQEMVVAEEVDRMRRSLGRLHRR